ncbi:hypothetical protein [Streptomyces sp. Isolate_45]|uniref:hypothetical protein n=1 Tax=Streptomyces sp. Isolate_45 TaxID=2950111 RepID=UPI002481CDD3|nr:hypothetical protein [Streptomyces sp. Isolate_45]MDA5279999.1 hypothetical protein [Streptomyces sp. Isolate_45]
MLLDLRDPIVARTHQAVLSRESPETDGGGRHACRGEEDGFKLPEWREIKKVAESTTPVQPSREADADS